jgi:hypothetical protein
VATLESQLADPELYRGEPGRAAQLQAELSACKGRLESLVQRWEELEGKREAFERSR